MGDRRPLLLVLVLLLLCVEWCLAGHKGHHHGHHNNHKLIELLTAGIVAKVLQKNDDEGGGGGHHGYYAVPIPVHSGGHHHHGSSGRAAASTHVTEKIIPIPVPHHTTRIIHINAGSHGLGGVGGEAAGGFDANQLGGFSDSGGGGDGYGDSSYDRPGMEVEGGDYDDRPHHSSPTVQQIMFHDGGVYGVPQAAPRPVLMRRPVVRMVHPAMPVRVAGMVPHHPVMAAAHHPLVRVRHYYPLASGRHRMLAYPPPMMPYIRYRPPPMPYQTMVAG